MYSPSGGDARVLAPPNARDTTTSMPTDHAPTWQREPYNRDVRLDRVDRDRVVTGKRDWNGERTSTITPFQRGIGGACVNGNSLAPPTKRRAQGRHISFFTENGRYIAAASRAVEPAPNFGAALENSLPRKFEREQAYAGTAVSPGFNGGFGNDCRPKDLEEPHSREPYLSSGDGRDVGSSAATDQVVRPYQSQVNLDLDNLLWDRDRSKGVSSSVNWELSQRSERDHRDRLRSNADLYSRRVGTSSQFDAARDWTFGDNELEGGRLDRYGSTSRDSFLGDSLSGSKDTAHVWRVREWTGSASSWGSSFAAGNGRSKEPGARGHGLDTSASPQHSPHSTPPSATLDPGRDDGNHPSPPKRPRLGWGQGLAKYEKKKVGDVDEVPGSGVSGGGVASGPHSGVDTMPTTVEEIVLPSVPCSPCSPAQTSVAAPISPSNQPIDSLSTVDCRSLEQDTTVQLIHGVGQDELDGTARGCSPVEKGTFKPADCALLLITQPAVLLQTTEVAAPGKEADRTDSLGTECTSELHTTKDVIITAPDVLWEGYPVSWTKETILQRVEKVEFEIDQVEKEIAKLELESSREVADGLSKFVTGEDPSAPALSCIAGEGGEPRLLPAEPPAAASSPLTERLSNSRVLQGNEGSVEAELDMVTRGQTQVLLDVVNVGGRELVPVLQERELKENMAEQKATSRGLSIEWGWECEQSHLLPIPGPGVELIDGPMAQLESCPLKSEMGAQVVRGPRSFANSLVLENQARHAADPFLHLLPEELMLGTGPLYYSPVEAPVWQHNVESHQKNYDRMLEKVAEQHHRLRFKEQVLTMRLRALKDVWRQEHCGICQRRDRNKAVCRNGVIPPSQCASLRLRPIQSGSGRLDAASEEVQAMKKVMAEPRVEHLRSVQKMPAMILDEKERSFRRFVNRNALVEDPIMVERERKTINPWTTEEKKIFLEKFGLYSKNFNKIALHLDHKTTADCVEYYYRNQKSEDFEKIRRRQQLKKRRDYSRSSASYLATNTQASSRHREANAARVDALSMVAAAASAASVGAKAVRSSSHHKVVDRFRANIPTLDLTNLPSCLEISRSVSANKASASNPLSIPSLVAAAAAVSSLGTTPCGFSSATPTSVKSCRERNPLKNASVAGPSTVRSCHLDQHPVGSKGARSIHVRREPSKPAGEEMDSRWTDDERQLFTEAIAMFGKDFQSIALHVTSKSQVQCKCFFSKARKRLGLDWLVEQLQAASANAEAAFNPQDSKPAGGLMGQAKATVDENMKDFVSSGRDIGCASEGERDKFVTEKPEEGVTGTVAVDEAKIVEGLDGAVMVGSDDIVTVDSMQESRENRSDRLAANLVLDGVVAAAVVVDKVKIEALSSTVIMSGCCRPEQVRQLEDKEGDHCDVAATAVAADDSTTGMLRKEINSEVAKGDETTLAPPEVERERVVDEAAAALVKISGMVQDQEELKATCKAIVKPELAAISATIEAGYLPPVPPSVVHSAAALISTTAVVHSAQQPREKAGRVGPGGEVKPRREPTSWTQEEKEKFAEIIRKYGKDWTLLHESLPAKSLTQIKTYFQNSKAKLGFAPLDGTGNTGGRGGGSRKRKADDCDTSSNNAGSGVSMNYVKGGSISSAEVDVGPQKVNSGMVAPPLMGATMGVATAVVGADSLALTWFGQRGQSLDQDPASINGIQKFIRQMCSANGFTQATAPGLFPLFHHGATPVFPSQGLQRAPHLGLQQQPAVSVLQKLTQSGSPRPQPLPPSNQQACQPALHQQAVHQLQQQQQTAQVVAQNQQQLQTQVVNFMQQQAAIQQQQQQTAQVVGPPLQHQVAVLQHQHQAVQRQQQQLLLNQQVTHHPHVQPQQFSSQQEGNALQPVANQLHPVGNPPQQVLQQVVQQLHQQQQQEQAQVAAAQVHAHMHHHQQSQHPLFLQPQDIVKAKSLHGAVTQPQSQQLSNAHSTVSLQQQQQRVAGPLLHHYEQQQQQHGQSPTVLRATSHTSTPISKGELLNQAEMVELRSSSSSGSSIGAKLQQLSPDELQQSAVPQGTSEQQGTSQRLTSSLSVDAQQMHPGDVKLFGQSLLSQPPSNVLAPTVARFSGTSNDRATLQQPVYPTLAGPTASLASSTDSMQKAYGKDPVVVSSAFGRLQVPFKMPDGRQVGWPTQAGNLGNMGLWNMVTGLQGAGLAKPADGEPEVHSVQEAVARMTKQLAREVQVSEGEQAMIAPPHKLQQPEQLRGVQELHRKEGLVVDQCVGGSLSLLGTGDMSMVDCERRGDLSQGTVNCGGDRGSLSGSRSSRGQPNYVNLQVAPAVANNQVLPRAVMEALMAIADWQSIRSTPSHTNTVVPQRSHEELQTWEAGGFRREPSGCVVDPVKASIALGLAASLATKSHLSGPEVLQQCLRDSSMHFPQQNMLNLSGPASVSSSAWNSGNGLLHASEAQHPLVAPTLTSFPRSSPRSSTGAEEHLRPADSRDAGNTSGGVG